MTKEERINRDLEGGPLEVDVAEVDGLCDDFIGIIYEGGVQVDTDGSKYVTVSDLEGNYYDIDINHIEII